MEIANRNVHTILHITPHLGGGVGSVLINYLRRVSNNPALSHEVISLEYANDKAIQASKIIGFHLADKMSYNHQGILSAISEADIVLFHWWNHPLLNAFLVREALPPSRVIFWSHILGFHPPYVFTEPALNYPDIFVFASPLSHETPEVKKLSDERKEKLRHIWSTGGVEYTASVPHMSHEGFKIGYIGTVDYGKMHPHFLKMCGRVRIPDSQFIVCGGPSETQIQEEANRCGIGDRFLFTGKTDDIRCYLAEFDIFGYPLAPYHYGTCEQVLGESMAAGIPPVVMANLTESYIVKDGVTGIVAENEDSYVRALESLYANSKLRKSLSIQARKDALQLFSLDRMISKWEKIFEEIMFIPKSERRWQGTHRGRNISPANIFVESLGEYGGEFSHFLNANNEKDKKKSIAAITRLLESSHLWRASTRGTPRHYHYFFPEDKDLRNWIDLYTTD